MEHAHCKDLEFSTSPLIVIPANPEARRRPHSPSPGQSKADAAPDSGGLLPLCKKLSWIYS